MIDFHSQLSIIPEVYETATLQDNLEHSGGITVSWKAKTDGEIPIGSYITYNGTRYILLEQYAPTRQDAVHYRYDPTFRHPMGLIDRTPFWIRSKDSSGATIDLRTTSFTGYPGTIAKKLCDFFSEYVQETGDTFFRDTIGTDWTFDMPFAVDQSGRLITTHTIITVAFDSCSIKSAASAIADAMGCNVFFDWTPNTEGKKTIRFIAGTTIQGEAYNCFHVLGGTTNMGKRTVRDSFSTVTQRMTLADPVEGQDTFVINNRTYKILKGSIISGIGNDIRLIKDIILDDIYPKMELYISNVHERECYLTDEKGDYIVESGNTYKTYSKWYIQLSYDKAGENIYNFNQRYLIDDQPLSLLFQVDYEHPENMSSLVGNQFELTYFPSDTFEKDKTDAAAPYDGTAGPGYTAKAGWFRIAFTAVNDIILPTSSRITGSSISTNKLYPQKGDKVTLVNMALGDGEKARAQSELLNAAKEIIQLMQTPSGEYTETMFLKSGETVEIGGVTPFEKSVAPALRKHGSTVTAINHNLDTNVVEVTVGSWARKTRTGGMADKIETVTVSANASTTGGDAFSNGSFTGGAGSNSNTQTTLAFTQVKPDTLFSAYLSSLMNTVPCTYNFTPQGTFDLYTMIQTFYGTTDVHEECFFKLGSFSGLSIYQEKGKGQALSNTPLVPERSYDLNDDHGQWLRIHITNEAAMAEVIELQIKVNHPRHGDRELMYTINALRPGENMMRLDLDNEADMLAVDSTGRVRFSRTITTRARIYDGGSLATEGVSLIGTIEELKSAWTIGGCVPSITMTDGVATVTWEFTSAHTVTSGASIPIMMRYAHDGVERVYSANFSIGVLDTDAIYQLSPSPNAVNFVRSDDNTLKPDEVKISMALIKYDGNSTSGLGGCPKGYSVRYAYDTMPDTSTSGDAWPTTSGGTFEKVPVVSSTTKTDVCIALFYGTVMIDREAVPIVKDGKHGENVVRLDIDNEMDMVQTDSAGKVMTTRTVQTIVTLFDGMSSVSIGDPVVSAISYTDASGRPQQLSPTITPGGKSTAKTLSWQFQSGWTISNYEVTIKYTYLDKDYKAVFTIAASMGQPIWQLKPSMSSVPFQRGTDNKLTPESRNVGLTLLKIDGLSTQTYTQAQEGITVIYSTQNMPTSPTPDSTHFKWTSGDMNVKSSDEDLFIAMFNSNSKLLDRETVPVVKDGKDGENTIRVDLDNENDSMLYSSAKGLVSGKVTSTAYLYDGPNDKSSSATWLVTASGCTLESQSTSRNIVVSGMTAATGKVTAQATYTDAHGNKHVKSAALTLKKLVDVDKYDLVITPNAIAYNKSTDSPAKTVITIEVWRLTVDGVREKAAPPTGYATYLLDGTTQLTSSAANSFTYTSTNKDRSDITVKIAKSYTSTEYLDCETIPINKAENGTSAWIADLDNEMDSVACNLSGNPTANTTVSTNLSMFYGSTKKDFKINSITRNGSSSMGTGVTVKIDGTTGTSTSTQSNAHTVSVTYATNATISGKDDFAITLEPKDSSSDKRVLHFTVNGVRPGANGEPATIYSLVPSVNEVVKKKDGTYVPGATTKITCAVKKTVGGTTSDAPSSEYTLKYSLNGGTETAYPSGGIQVNTITSNLVFVVYNKSSVVLDRETIPLVVDGTDGTSPYFADIDNEMDSVACDSSGKTTSAYSAYIGVHVWHGSTPEALTKLTVTPTISGITITTDTTNKRFSVSINKGTQISTTNTFTITVASAKSGDMTLRFVLNGVRPGTDGSNAVLYKLVPNCSEVVKKIDGSYSVNNVSCTRQKIVGSTITDNTTDGSIVYKLDGGSETAYTNNTNISVSKFTKSIQFIFRVNNVIVDQESIPMVADGPKGDKGTGIAITLKRTGASNYTEANWNKWAAIGYNDSCGWRDGDPDFTKCRVGDYYMVVGSSYDKGIFHEATYECTAVSASDISGTCISHVKDGGKGDPGSAGHVGRWYYYDGEFKSSKIYKMEETQAPYVKYKNKFYMLDNKGGSSTTTQGLPPDATGDNPWSLMSSEHKYYIATAFFGDYAHLSAFVFNGDWMISTNGKIQGVEYNSSDWQNPAEYGNKAAYKWFDPVHPNSGNGFIPNVAIDGLTGNVYMNKAYVKGEVQATSGTFTGTVKATSGYFKGGLTVPLIEITDGNLKNYTDYENYPNNTHITSIPDDCGGFNFKLSKNIYLSMPEPNESMKGREFEIINSSNSYNVIMQASKIENMSAKTLTLNGYVKLKVIRDWANLWKWFVTAFKAGGNVG